MTKESRRTNSPKGLVPGGAVKKGRLIREDTMHLMGRGTVLPCDSALLRNDGVRANYERICRAYPLRASAAELVAGMARIEVDLTALQLKPNRTLEEQRQIARLMAALSSALTKLTTLHLKPHEVMPQ